MTRPRFACALGLLAMAALVLPLRAVPDPAEGAPTPWGGEESVAVELLTVPFYAVDAEGRPVLDLRADEVRLAVGDVEIVPDTFDAYPATGAQSPQPRAAGRRASAQRPRQVFVLLDRTFLGFAGWRNSQLAAIQLVDALPGEDHVTLLINDPQKGLNTVLTVAADGKGKRRFRDTVEKELAAANRIDAHAEEGFAPYVLGTGRNGVPTEQVHNAYEAGGALSRSEYRSIAYDLADNLELLALMLGRTQDSRLLVVFSNGIDDTLYFEGEVGFQGVGSSDAFASWVDTRRAEPMVGRFERAYAALAAAGVNVVVANPRPDAAVGQDMLHHLAGSVGGAIIEDPNPQLLLARVQAATGARYELGVYAQKLPPGFAAERSRVVITRPGVRATSPARLPRQKTYKELLAHERKMLIVEFVMGKAEAPALLGQVRSAAEASGARRLRFDAQRPTPVGDQAVDLYDVLLRTGGEGKQPELVSYGERLGVAAGKPLEAEAKIPKGTYLWAILAVEPKSGDVYLRRLQIAPPTGAAEPRR